MLPCSSYYAIVAPSPVELVKLTTQTEICELIFINCMFMLNRDPLNAVGVCCFQLQFAFDTPLLDSGPDSRDNLTEQHIPPLDKYLGPPRPASRVPKLLHHLLLWLLSVSSQGLHTNIRLPLIFPSRKAKSKSIWLFSFVIIMLYLVIHVICIQ